LPDLPGRGLTQAGLQFQAALPGSTQAILGRARSASGGGVAPPLRLLPTLVEEAALMSAGNPRGGPASGQRGHPPAPRAGSRGHGGGGPGDCRSPSRSTGWRWWSSTCSGGRRSCSSSGMPGAASRACCA
jgi:hypothetical protein